MYLIVSPFSKTFDDLGLIYELPDSLEGDAQIGQIVEIPLKTGSELALVLDIKKEIQVDYDISKIKAISCIFDKRVFLNKNQISIVSWIAKYYFTPIHNAARLYFPKNLIGKIEKIKLDLDSGMQKKYNFNHNLDLSPAQDKVYNDIKNSHIKKTLLYGITGSGKTEIYIKLIQDNILAGKQTLVLIPEIILTNQILERLKKVFGGDVISLNSSITEATKTKHWIDIYRGNAKLIIGTRSALFYPYNNLATIIIDEEHDNSYISDQAPRYNTIEVANKITELNGNQLILASGTPSVTSMYKVMKDEDFQVVNLLEKFK